MASKMETIKIPSIIQNDINALYEGMNNPDCKYVDCLKEELAATINAAASDNIISDELANYLFDKYLHR